MSSSLRFLLLTHPGLGEGLLDAARSILGHMPAVELLTNRDLAPEQVEAKIRAWLAESPGPCIIFTDLSFGSLCQAAQKSASGREDVGIVSGVNLPLLLAGLRSGEYSSMAEHLEHIAKRGSDGVETFTCESP